MPPKRTATAAAADTADTDFDSLKVDQLKAECTQRSLETTGKKADLIARLKAHEAGAGKKAKTAPATSEPAAAAPAKKGRGKAAAAPAVDSAPVADAAPAKKPAVKRGKSAAKAAAAPEPADEKTQTKKVFEALSVKKASKLRPNAKVDASSYMGNSHKVYSSATETFDAMLNQTNIGQNNNKFYIIQILQNKSWPSYCVWTRWGRVGEVGQNAMIYSGSDISAAIDAFSKKFKDKSANNWSTRDKFVKKQGKYDLVEMADEEEPAPAALLSDNGVPKKIRPSTLDSPTQSFVKLIFDKDMFKSAMAKFEIDVKKMPLGQISKSQLARGYEVLTKIEEVLEKKTKGNLSELSSSFYTIIPHDFGRLVPPVISTREALDKKIEMLVVLGDIEIAQKLLEVPTDSKAEEIDHPDDTNYKSLKCELKTVDRSSNEFNVLNTYLKETMGRPLELQELWSVDRDGEDARCAENDSLTNRKLLWHGTNVAVVAAILKSGLRIMPHSRGRVGRGIYFASENAKSSAYVGTTPEGNSHTGIMFLVEVALGKEHHITRDDSSLVKAPAGFDCVIAKGSGEPDPAKDTTLKMSGRDVTVPQGKRINMPQYAGSSFDKSEYLVYKESQHRIRYALKLKFPSSGHWH